MRSVEYPLTEYSFATGYRIEHGDYLPLTGKQVLASHRARNEMDMRMVGNHYEITRRPMRAPKGNEKRRVEA